ncbi:MAG TPA: citrate/2-methylcitrate synthase [Isosphaeraceae bacterium]|jgi:citrate synthase|nr:citrate/2-methylcitrate synthase [Isosphaeraceae bacterium]
MSSPTTETYYPGLEGVIASETAIANIEGREGAGGLEYRGYDIEELAHGASYEETAFLLLHGDLPTVSQLRDFQGRLKAVRRIPESLVELYRHVPKAVHPMDVLRTSVSVLAHFDPEVNAAPTDHAANVRKAERLLAQIPTAVAAAARIRRGQEVIPPDDTLDHSADFLKMVTGKVPSETMRKAFDLSLVLYTEHELNASTFAARVTVSTLSDLYSGIVSAIGTLKGPLHGGANEEAWKLLERVGAPEKAAAWIEDALARKERIMGFGHRVYKTGDPRARILKEYCTKLAAEIGDDRWERIAEPIEQAVTEQKKLPPNVDWPSARLYHYMGLDISLYTPIFALARVAGWSAHIIEQLDHNRLMRPRARYVGPPNRTVRPIEQRG